MNMQDSYLTLKPHYEILDGLRGVAAAMIVVFHLLEVYSGGNHLNQIINHGYLAIDLFFMFPGSVIGYIYDDRWNKMNTGTFFKRRLIRPQLMVVMGSIVGAVLFWFQEAPCYPVMEGASVGTVLLVVLLGCTLLPPSLKWNIRGWMEMYSLNGPAWSLYYEYIGNILYALFIRKFSKTALTVLVAIAACFAVHRYLTAPASDIVGGWTLSWEQQHVGLIRLIYPFSGGLLLSWPGRLIRTRKNIFRWCSLMIIVVLSVPRIGGEEGYWMNGFYEASCITCILLIIASMGVGDRITGKRPAAVCKFSGDISYPVYITHYPLVYIYMAWVFSRQATLVEGLPYMLPTFMGTFALACVCLKCHDPPVCKQLAERFLRKK